MDKVELKEICDDFELPERDRNFAEKVGSNQTGQTAERDQYRVLSEFILRKKIESVVDKMIASNQKLADSNEKYSEKMVNLTRALVFVGIAQVIATAVQVFTQWK